MLDLTKNFQWYCFRELVTNENGQQSLEIPHSDPHFYEEPVDYSWDTPEQAMAHIQEGIEEEWYTKEETDNWLLCRQTISVVSPLDRFNQI